MISESTIQAMATKLGEAFQPDCILLFGSQARGDAGEFSDVDFLVVTQTDLPKPQRSVAMYRLLRDFNLPVDILVYTPQEVADYRALPQSLIWRAFLEGHMLYEKSA